MLSIQERIAAELNVGVNQVAAAVGLLDDGATVPFVARYRKEVTGGLDDVQLRALEQRLGYLRELEDRREAIVKSITEQGKMTPALEASIREADTKARLEDLYLPYKPKRRTKGQIAREAGIEPLAELLLGDPTRDPATEAAAFLNAEAGFADTKAVLDGARHILMERFAEDAELVGRVRRLLREQGQLQARVVEGKETEGAKFADYFAHAEPLSKVPSHRALAMFRGRNEGVLYLAVDLPGAAEMSAHPCEGLVAAHAGIGDKGRPADAWLMEVARWTWRVRLSVHVVGELLTELREAAEAEAIRVFAANLRDLLLAAPAGHRACIGLDPGLRTGVKVVALDGTGKLLEYTTIYPHVPQNKWRQSLDTLAALARKHGSDLIAIGNGTASRETEKLAAELIAAHPELGLTRVVVSEAGASVYSASELASQEFPDLDVSIRGAISIARRLQDPLAELVKIEPKSIGVGQYQHDVNQLRLSQEPRRGGRGLREQRGRGAEHRLGGAAGRVSGLGGSLAQAIVAHRDQHGPFRSREALRQVPRLGARTFEQCAGFLRVARGDNPLDASAVHPESYPVVERIAAAQGCSVSELIGNAERVRGLDPCRFVDAGGRRAHGARHPARAGEARARPAPGVQHRDLQGRRGAAEGPGAGHGAGRHGDQRRQLRRLRGHRRAPGRAGARLGAQQPLREGSARGGEGRRRGEGEGARGRHRAQAHRPDHAPRRRGAGRGCAAAQGRRRAPAAGACERAAPAPAAPRGAARQRAQDRHAGRTAAGGAEAPALKRCDELLI